VLLVAAGSIVKRIGDQLAGLIDSGLGKDLERLTCSLRAIASISDWMRAKRASSRS
jgi:hypothetical protein